MMGNSLKRVNEEGSVDVSQSPSQERVSPFRKGRYVAGGFVDLAKYRGYPLPTPEDLKENLGSSEYLYREISETRDTYDTFIHMELFPVDKDIEEAPLRKTLALELLRLFFTFATILFFATLAAIILITFSRRVDNTLDMINVADDAIIQVIYQYAPVLTLVLFIISVGIYVKWYISLKWFNSSKKPCLYTCLTDKIIDMKDHEEELSGLPEEEKERAKARDDFVKFTLYYFAIADNAEDAEEGAREIANKISSKSKLNKGSGQELKMNPISGILSPGPVSRVRKLLGDGRNPADILRKRSIRIEATEAAVYLPLEVVSTRRDEPGPEEPPI
jgi:hypothetical protein